MTYLPGTLTDSNAPSVLYADLAAALATEGYTLEDTFVVTTTTYKVWKNPAANNAAGLDWYLIVAYTTTGAGSLVFTASEGWNTGTHQAVRPIYQVSSTSGTNILYIDGSSVTSTLLAYDVATGSPRGDTLLTLQTPPTNIVFMNRTLPAPATSFGYWISVSPNRVAWIDTGGPQFAGYVGLYAPDPWYVSTAAASGHPEGAGIFPLVSAQWSALSGSSDHTTRRVGVSRIGGFQDHLRLINGAGILASDSSWSTIVGLKNGYSGNVKRTPSGDLNGPYILPGFNDVGPAKGPVDLNFSVGSHFGMKMGALYDIATLPVDASVARGDTIDSGAYVLTSANTSSYNSQSLAIKTI